MSIEAWCDTARRSHYRNNADQQRAIDTLKTVFEGKEDPDSAASTISSIYNPLLKRDFSLSPVIELWSIICEAVKIIGGNREIDARLISLLNSISKLPDVVDKNNKAINPGNGTSGVYWKDLPGLAIMLREYAMDIEPETSEMPDEGDWTDSQRTTLLNVTTFGALHLAYGRVPLGMPFHAEVSLMDGIEVPYQTPEQQRRAVTDVPPAVIWILLAGEKIHELCVGNYERQDDRGRGYSLGRWGLWMRRFREIVGYRGLEDGVRDGALKAASQMGRIAG